MDIKYQSSVQTKDDLYKLYDEVEWNDILNLNKEELYTAMESSWYVVYAYDNDRLIGTGRIVSDGIISSYLCGLCVCPEYRNKGIGTNIIKMLVKKCRQQKLTIQLFCKEELVPFYNQRGFHPTSVGMKLKRLDLE